MSISKVYIILVCLFLGCFTSIVNASCPSTLNYDKQTNPISFTNYGYSDPFVGFKGAYLSQPFRSSHYSKNKTHLGTDFGVNASAEVFAICSGTVVQSQDMTY